MRVERGVHQPRRHEGGKRQKPSASDNNEEVCVIPTKGRHCGASKHTRIHEPTGQSIGTGVEALEWRSLPVGKVVMEPPVHGIYASVAGRMVTRDRT